MARKKKTTFTANFDNVGKGFAAEQEYLVKVTECTVEEGENAPYFAMKLEGTGEHKGSIMYHNASLSPNALWRTREVFEAFLGEVPKGDFDPADYADEFVDKVAMCSTFKDTYNGQTRIKPEDFWASEDGADAGGEDGDVEFDLDEVDDADIVKLGKALGIKAKKAAAIRKELEDADEDEVLEAAKELGLIEDEGDGDGDGEGEGIDLDELDDDDIKALAKAAGIKGKVVKKLKAELAELDADDLREAAEEAGIDLGDGEGDGEGDGDAFDLDEASDDDIKALAEAAGIKGKVVKKLKAALAELSAEDLAEAVEEAGLGEGGGDGEGVTAEAINEMSQDELEALIEEHELEVDLDEHKTLRKKRSAVVDAAEEAGILSDD